jgi:UDP-N-acetylmuramate dehydrogenase
MPIEILENVPLKSLTTMGVGGEARFLVHVKKTEELAQAVSWAREQKLPIFVLGGGSNTLVSDAGFPGLVIKIEIAGKVYENVHHGARVTVGAGEVWDDFVRDTVLRNLWGIENLSLIPGTVGGATVQNIGAYGVDARKTIVEVEAFDIEKMSTKWFAGHKCKFGYRESIFKKDKNLVVTRVIFDLPHNGTPHLDYEDVKIFFKTKGVTNPTLQNIRDAIIEIRTAKMPGAGVGTAGSFFKDPVVPMGHYEELKAQFPGLKAHLQGDNTAKLSAAWLLDKVFSLRGVRNGGAGVSEKHSLVLVNHGDASAQEIISLANEIKRSVEEKINVVLEEEVVML